MASAPVMFDASDLVINETAYQWCVRAFSLVQRQLGLQINVHDADEKIGHGQIFLFNHFARFETIIPQYVIHRATGAFCRTVATHELFGSGRLAKLLTSLGGVPNTLDGLLPFLAAEILRGRKVVVFPEGGMIKDRQVVDAKGKFQVFSPTAQIHRKHHKGAAAIAVMLEIFKKRIASVDAAGETARLERWAMALGFDSLDGLRAAAATPTRIVPANITFFPVRTDDNLLKRIADLLTKDLNERAREELLIEGNILFKNTDMDIRFGPALEPNILWRWWERWLLDWTFVHIDSLERLFDMNTGASSGIARLAPMMIGRNTRRLRDLCTRQMYAHVTANLSHLASRLLLQLAARGHDSVGREVFHRTLYSAVKFAQQEPSIFLHKSLDDPEVYDGLHAGKCANLQRLITLASGSGLIEQNGHDYRLLPKLSEAHAFDQVRLENTVQVYANEIAPVAAVRRAVDRALKQITRLDDRGLGQQLFDDELRAHALCKATYAQERYAEVNQQETATESGAPFLLLPKAANGLGVVLVHGFLASPAELRDFGEALHRAGYAVLGVRLKGHGTSPWDLRNRSWLDWRASVERGCEILSAFVERICLVGFSTGGCLALRVAAEVPAHVAGVVAVSAPIKLRNKAMRFVPVIHGANKLAEWTWSLEGVMPFRRNESEHPHINYRHIPVRGLFELRRAIDDLNRNLRNVACPTAIVQGTEDPVVVPRSAQLIYDKIASNEKVLHWVEADRHGILNEDIGGTWRIVKSFVDTLANGGLAGRSADLDRDHAPPPVAAGIESAAPG